MEKKPHSHTDENDNVITVKDTGTGIQIDFDWADHDYIDHVYLNRKEVVWFAKRLIEYLK